MASYSKVVALAVLVSCISLSLCEEATGQEKEVQAKAVKEEKDIWFMSLGWNLLGYATIIVPAALIIRFVKTSGWKDRLKGTSPDNSRNTTLCSKEVIYVYQH